MKINGWPEAEKRSHSCPSQREAQELIGMRVCTLHRAHRRKGSDEVLFSLLTPPFPLSVKRFKYKGHEAVVFPKLIKILFSLLLQLPLLSSELSTQQQEKGRDVLYFGSCFPIYITLKTKDDLRMKVNIDSPVQLLTLFTCLLFIEMDLSCSQPSSCPVIWAVNWWWLQLCMKFRCAVYTLSCWYCQIAFFLIRRWMQYELQTLPFSKL